MNKPYPLALRLALRAEKGRSLAPKIQIMRCDFPRYGRAPIYARDPDPILALWRVRALAIERRNDPVAQIAYGAMLQRVVSPVVTLP